jgi:hypothetical protein
MTLHRVDSSENQCDWNNFQCKHSMQYFNEVRETIYAINPPTHTHNLRYLW